MNKSAEIRILLITLILLAIIPAILSCKKKTVVDDSSDILVTVGDSVLTLNMALNGVPRGLEANDSLQMLSAVVEGWLRKQVLTDLAERQLGSTEEIDRLVDDYRTNLILSRYLSGMEVKRNEGEERRQIDAYYKAAGDSMILEEPIVKGLYLKVSSDDLSLPSLRRWMKEADDKAVDNIESHGLRHAMQYDYFIDKWHPWHEVAGLVPYRFFDADAFLASTRDFETEYEGAIYLLHISDFRGTGERMPEEYAKSKITEMVRHSNMSARRKKLITAIYKREIEEGHVTAGLYDPMTGNLKSKNKEDK